MGTASTTTVRCPAQDGGVTRGCEACGRPQLPGKASPTWLAGSCAAPITSARAGGWLAPVLASREATGRRARLRRASSSGHRGLRAPLERGMLERDRHPSSALWKGQAGRARYPQVSVQATSGPWMRPVTPSSPRAIFGFYTALRRTHRSVLEVHEGDATAFDEPTLAPRRALSDACSQSARSRSHHGPRSHRE
jgi:hypothetical protein